MRILRALLIAAKRPAPGRTKTRLTPPLSPSQAANLFECFLLDTIETVRQVPDVHRIIAYLPASAQAYFERIAPDFLLWKQEGPDLGSRLDHALQASFTSGYASAVIMNSDSPTLPYSYLVEAFESLGHADVVLGPCDDGGYYLIGLTRPIPRLLREVQMSSPQVSIHTQSIAEEMGLKVHLLPAWYDVDDIESLKRLDGELNVKGSTSAVRTQAYLHEIHSTLR